MPPAPAVVTNVRGAAGSAAHVGACGYSRIAANRDQTVFLPLGGLQEPIISRLPSAGPGNTGHTETPSWNTTPLIVMVLPVGTVADAPQNANCPGHTMSGVSARAGPTQSDRFGPVRFD